MGNLCGKQSSSGFNSTGRVLGSAPNPPPSTARTPPAAAHKPKISGVGKTLGASGGESSAAGGTAPDARAAAAQAAEARAARQNSGKIGAQLEEQKRKTQNQHLAELGKSKGQPEQLVWD